MGGKRTKPTSGGKPDASGGGAPEGGDASNVPPSRHYDFHAVSGMEVSYRSLPSTLKTNALRPVAEAFARNMDRVYSLSVLPMELCFWAARFAEVYVFARASAGLPVDAVEADARPDLTAERLRLWREIQVGFLPLPEARQTVLGEGGHMLQHFISRQNAYLGPGLEAVLSAMILDAWTAFEALAGDLWVAAVNTGPKEVFLRVIKQQTDRTEGDPTEAGQAKTIPLKTLAEFGFDLRGRAGELLVRQKKVDFLSLNATVSAYRAAFGSDAPAVFGVHPDLYITEALRNLFAHRGGVMDQKARSQLRKLPDLAATEIGEPVRLSGPLVLARIDPLVRCAVDLCRFVDERSDRNAQNGA